MARDELSAGEAVRTIALLGPNPMPPWVIRSSVPVTLRQEIRHWLIEMAQDTAGAAILATTPIARFVTVDHQAYQPIAEILRQSRLQS
jgi:ABC-type phosphate/phosphonate transport system substrate-binding protein